MANNLIDHLALALHLVLSNLDQLRVNTINLQLQSFQPSVGLRQSLTIRVALLRVATSDAALRTSICATADSELLHFSYVRDALFLPQCALVQRLLLLTKQLNRDGELIELSLKWHDSVMTVYRTGVGFPSVQRVVLMILTGVKRFGAYWLVVVMVVLKPSPLVEICILITAESFTMVRSSIGCGHEVKWHFNFGEIVFGKVLLSQRLIRLWVVTRRRGVFMAQG